MFKNPLKTPEAKSAISDMNTNLKQAKLSGKNQQRKTDLAKKIAVKKNPERGHEERLAKRMSDEGDRSANDYRG